MAMPTRSVLEQAMLDIEETTGASTESMRTSLHHAAPETVHRLWFRLRDFCVARFSNNKVVANIYDKALKDWEDSSTN